MLEQEVHFYPSTVWAIMNNSSISRKTKTGNESTRNPPHKRMEENMNSKKRARVCMCQTGWPGVDATITIFCDFHQLSAKKWRFSYKPMLRSANCKIQHCVLHQKTAIFTPIFWRKYLKNHNIGLRLEDFTSTIGWLFTFGSFLKITEEAYIHFWAKVCCTLR
jgi:hypothetical protein